MIYDVFFSYLCIKIYKGMKQTKIVASVSDRRCDVDFIRSLYDAGVNVIRMNTAHATPDGIKTIIKNVRSVSSHIGILIDTKGPEVRTTGCQAPIEYKTGDVVKIFGRPEMDTEHDIINLSYPDFASDVHEGDHVLFDDGALDMQIIGINGPQVVAQVKNDGVLGSHKNFIAHSFVRSAADVRAVQAILDAFNSDIKIISKIENQEGVDHIDEIIEASYGVMIARGDLGIEVPIERIPGIQRQIIHKCIMAKKPVIVATQMLHTMINNPRPTRAEVTDIANAIYSHTDALMLSGETASGKYPIEAVKTMATIAEQAERDLSLRGQIDVPLSEHCDIREFMAYSAIEATEKLGVKGIITDNVTGNTARMLAAFRGPHPVLAICYKDKLQRLLNLSYGVIPVYQKDHLSGDALFKAAVRMLRQKGLVELEDKIAYLSGNVAGGGGTKFLEINTVKETLDDSYHFHLPNI